MISSQKQPADAATLIILDRSGPLPKVLLGRRHARHVFMPGKFVFPGGRVEAADADMPVAAALPPAVEQRLLREVEGPKKASAFPLAAIRETFEETGLLLGARASPHTPPPPGVWSDFAQSGILPDLSALHFITRAITPPGFVRRFDARFFAADAEAIAHRIENIVHTDAELVELAWVSIAEARKLDVPIITELVLEELEERVAAGMSPQLPVPFFRLHDGNFERGLL